MQRCYNGIMRHFLHVLCLALCVVIFSVLSWYFLPSGRISLNRYVSPLPSFLTLTQNNQVRFLDLWLPSLSNKKVSAADKYTAESILMFDLTTNKTLMTKNINMRLPMASLTKLMTVIIALENAKSDNKYIVTRSDLVGEDSMGLSPGEVLSLNDLLYGIFLNSANDAAETLASNYPGGRDAFITAMNRKAQALGLKDTHFTNPTGLQGDGNQYTTAYDLLVICKYLLHNFPQVLNISSQYTHVIPASNTHKEFDLTNEVNLISTYPGVKGLKDGYTPQAGWCLISYLDYDHQHILGIILNSQDRRGEMKKLLDYSLEEISITPPPPA